MGLLDYIKKVLAPSNVKTFDQLIDLVEDEAKRKKQSFYQIEVNQYEATQKILALTDKEKVKFVLYLIEQIHSYFKDKSSWGSGDKGWARMHVQDLYLTYFFKVKIVLDEEDVEDITNAFVLQKRYNHGNVTYWPISQLLTQITRNFSADNLPDRVQQSLKNLKSEIEAAKINTKDSAKIVDRIDSLLFKAGNDRSAVRPVLFVGDDGYAEFANPMINAVGPDEKPGWYKALAHAQKASGGKPTNKFLAQGKEIIQEIGPEKFKKMIVEWLDFISHLKERVKTHSYQYANNETREYNSYEFIAAPNLEMIKGLVWMCSQFDDTKTLQTIAAVAERSFKKIPGVGPAAQSLGNAALYTLFKSKGLEGIAHLSRLKLRIKQNSTQSLIEKYLTDAAKSQGISVAEIEDLAVDDYGLQKGTRFFEVDDYRAKIEIKAVGDVALQWFKPDGTPMKSVPTAVKEKHKDQLKKIKDTATQIDKALTAQRDRIDRMFRTSRKMSWAYFEEHYLNHGLMSFLANNLLWQFEAHGKTEVVIHLQGYWTNIDYGRIEPDVTSIVSLWHPAMATVGEIKKWREFLLNAKIQQPLKQAYREVYLLTDAEIRTRTYSNRMAAHILKQHQFNSLAKGRGWKYSLLGAYDDGRDNEIAELAFAENNLRAEYWVNEVNADNAFNDTGIWNFVATDQVRFVNTLTNQPEELINIPPVIFSEVMRDVDLFVGVASVGNDPNWNDNGGLPAHRNYWESYSFGELTEIAKTRKEILENLVPRLKIANVASVKDKFLVVKGKKRTYKIHIGSTNILMEPNDQYLCIVPDRSKKENPSNVFLPFEGDSGLAVILSKAFLLADDDKISDTTITSQINRH